MSNRKSDIDWDGVAAAYLAQKQTLAEIGDEFGVSVTSICRRAKREGWPRRAAVSKQKPDPGSAVEFRLARALDRQIKELEERWSETNALAGPVQAEKEARTLNVLIRTAEKLKELQMAKTKPTGSKRDQEKTQAAALDRKRLRETLERRLDKLLAAADARGVSRDAVGGGD